jgi:hypothetical protein
MKTKNEEIINAILTLKELIANRFECGYNGKINYSELIELIDNFIIFVFICRYKL